MPPRRVLLVAVLALVLAGADLVNTLVDAGAFKALTPHGLDRCTGAEELVFEATVRRCPGPASSSPTCSTVSSRFPEPAAR